MRKHLLIMKVRKSKASPCLSACPSSENRFTISLWTKTTATHRHHRQRPNETQVGIMQDKVRVPVHAKHPSVLLAKL
jgi:hypothetical protein